jgi:HAE1 family hydrophobic/amphiphilic exporter-1
LSGTPSLTGNPFASTTTLLLDRVNILSDLQGIPPVAVPPGSELPGFLQGGYGQSLSNLFSNDFRTFRFGVALSFPLKNRTAEGQLGRAVAEGRKIGAQRKTLEQTIEVEVRNAVQAVETARLRVETARASREAAEKQSESEQRRFQAGLSTTYFVLERQNNLSAAQGRELKAMTDYSKAVTELQRVMGTTLTSANVDVNPAPKK